MSRKQALTAHRDHKYRYETREQAEAAAEAYNRDIVVGWPYGAYPCGDHWHTGHTCGRWSGRPPTRSGSPCGRRW